VPFRIEIGLKECQNDALFVGRRDREYKERQAIPRQQFVDSLVAQLDELQEILFERAKTFRTQNTVSIQSKEEFYKFFTDSEGGFAMAHWNGDPEVEAKIKQDLNVTIRCIPLEEKPVAGKCIFSGGDSTQQVVFAKAY
jgi:prolyl-tRNA synthetase